MEAAGTHPPMASHWPCGRIGSNEIIRTVPIDSGARNAYVHARPGGRPLSNPARLKIFSSARAPWVLTSEQVALGLAWSTESDEKTSYVLPLPRRRFRAALGRNRKMRDGSSGREYVQGPPQKQIAYLDAPTALSSRFVNALASSDDAESPSSSVSRPSAIACALVGVVARSAY